MEMDIIMITETTTPAIIVVTIVVVGDITDTTRDTTMVTRGDIMTAVMSFTRNGESAEVQKENVVDIMAGSVVAIMNTNMKVNIMVAIIIMGMSTVVNKVVDVDVDTEVVVREVIK